MAPNQVVVQISCKTPVRQSDMHLRVMCPCYQASAAGARSPRWPNQSSRQQQSPEVKALAWFGSSAFSFKALAKSSATRNKRGVGTQFLETISLLHVHCRMKASTIDFQLLCMQSFPLEVLLSIELLVFPKFKSHVPEASPFPQWNPGSPLHFYLSQDLNARHLLRRHQGPHTPSLGATPMILSMSLAS